MKFLEDELKSFGRFSHAEIKRWGKEKLAHEVVMSLLRKGMFFSKLPFGIREHRTFGSADGCIAENAPKSKLLYRAILDLADLMSTSYEPKQSLQACTYRDVFLEGTASRALNSVFLKKGWSSLVWPERYVRRSTFRAAVGMAMVAYAIYLKDSLEKQKYDLAITQCADAFSLLLIDLEKKSSLKNKENRAVIAEMPARILSSKGKLAVEKKLQNDPKQNEKSFVKECWSIWQARPSSYKSKAAFARDMLGKCEHLTSQKKIEDWCREWEKETRTQPA